VKTRFAPSPTGPLHLGHAFSALTAFGMARRAGGVCLLRMDDIDRDRSRPQWEAQAKEDLAWLGMTWPEPVVRQSERLPAYRAAIDALARQGLVYPCRCTRGDIAAAASAPQEGVPTHGPDGPIYPGTCRGRPMSDYRAGDALRLDMRRAVDTLMAPLSFEETGPAHAGMHRLSGDRLVSEIGDIVLSRRAGDPAYHIAVAVEDAAQGITVVIRGEDLFEATAIHVLLQSLMGFSTPVYHHHRLIRDERGKRLAKRDDARAIARYREDGLTPADVMRLIGSGPELVGGSRTA